MAGVNAVAAAATATGLVFIWTGLKGGSVLRTFQSLIQGQRPTAGTPTYPVGTPTGGGSASADSSTPSSDAPGGTVAQNKAIGKQLAAAYGWSTGAEWDALEKLWTRESGWNSKARNPSSGAYGIPQALPASKMGTAANPPTSSASAQIKWGLAYIRGRYGSPTAAWAHEQSAGWY